MSGVGTVYHYASGGFSVYIVIVSSEGRSSLALFDMNRIYGPLYIMGRPGHEQLSQIRQIYIGNGTVVGINDANLLCKLSSFYYNLQMM